MEIIAIIPAAGSGSRMTQTSERKQFMDLCGKPVIEWTLEAIGVAEQIKEILLVVPPKEIESVKEKYAASGKFPKVGNVIAGGEKRTDSVYNGVKAANAEWVLIHDAARPFVSGALIKKTVQAAAEHGAATAALPVQDTVKLKNGELLGKTIDRDSILLIQTPQVFRRSALLSAFEKAKNKNIEWTDETSLMESCGYKVAWVAGEVTNLKITTPADLPLAEKITGRGP